MKKALVRIFLVLVTSALFVGCSSNDIAATQTPNIPSSSDVSTPDISQMPDETAPAAEETPEIPENSISGDPSSEDSFVIWGWNEDFLNILSVIEKNYSELAARIVFVNTGGSDYYENKLDEILQDPENEIYPDMMLLEVDFVQKYVNSDFLMSIDDLGISAEDMSHMYEYNIQLGTDNYDKIRALFWQATPGSFQVRADLAEKYLGTTNPYELQSSYFSTWDKIVETARSVNQESGGMVKLLSGYTDVFRVFLNSSRQIKWYDENDVIHVDDLMIEYMELCKTLYDDDSTFNTIQWQDGWVSQKDGNGETTEAAIAYCGCPWYTYWCLTETWESNTILVQGPAQFYWGGTGIATTVHCADIDMAAQLTKAITCDSDFMADINAQNGDYVNNKETIAYLLENGIGNSTKMIAGQNLIEFYQSSADSIDASNVSDVDQKAQALFQTEVGAYATGLKDLETAIYDFKVALNDQYSFLKIE